MGFSDLKKSSRGSMDFLQKKLEESKGSSRQKDERFWRPELDKSSNGYAEVRFLPSPEGEDLPWVKLYSHAFQGSGGWYIENSLTTIGKKDPVSEMNSQLWNTGLESDKDIARERRRKLNYISNVYVVSDPANPQNEGKVFLYKYGKKIFDKINEAMQPEFADEEAVNPFDLWSGANFKLKIRKVAGYVNYDKSHFDSAGALNESDEYLETVWKSQHSLQQFVAEDQFKSYDDLKSRVNDVLGGDLRGKAGDTSTAEDFSNKSETSTETTAEKEPASSGEEQDAMSFFEKLANE
tara:strand:+ start:3542 stop:4423 length:882 start_codon:yes stop_codon:yes gene_type:complete